MFNAHAERNRRIAQIEEIVLRMDKRFHQKPGNDLFLVFDEEAPNGDAGLKKNRAAKRLAIGAGFAESSESAGTEDWQGGNAPKRFMQWCFSPNWFFVELPSTTLDPSEADRILRDRSGFRFIGGAPPLHYKPATVGKFNPFVKFYLYGDERVAAEDAAHVWFDVWKFPLDWTFYATAAAFMGKRKFESGRPVA